MKFARPSVEDHTQPAVIAANLHAMVKCPVLYVQSPVKSAAIIQNVASFVTSLVRHVLRIVLGLVHIKDGAYYRVQYPAICSHAHSAAQIFWLAGIDVRQFVEIVAQALHIARNVRTQQSKKWSLTSFYHPLSRRSILMKILASCHHVDIFSP